MSPPLEGNLQLRLLQRSTRSLPLTEAGERFLHSIRDHLESLQGAIAAASNEQSEPAGVLKLSMSPTFGISDILPLLPAKSRQCCANALSSMIWPPRDPQHFSVLE